MIAKIWNKYNKFIKYSVIGAISASIDFGVFYLLNTHTSMHYMAINVISISCGITNSFFMNAKLNFRVHDNYIKRYIKFYAVGVLGIIISNILLFVLHGQMNISVMISKFITIFIVVIVQFFLNSKYSLASKNV